MDKNLKQVILQFIKFGIVGAFNTVLTLAIYYAGLALGIHYQLCNIIAFIITVFISYLLNGKLVFKQTNGQKTGFFVGLIKVYMSYAFTSLFLNAILLGVQVEFLGISKEIAPIFNLVFTIPINFLLNKFWVYRKKEKENE